MGFSIYLSFMKDDELIEKAKNGDIGALETVLKNTEREIYAYLFFLTKNENDILDISQEALLKISKKIHTLKNPSLYKPWVNKIVLNQYYDFLRKNKKFKKEEYCEIPDTIPNKNDDFLGEELLELIKKSVCKLPETYKIPILMREFEGLSYSEIAKITNTNVGTVKSRIARARNKLKNSIKPYMEL